MMKNIIGSIIAVALILYVAAIYQPYRHTLFNNSQFPISALQQHYGHLDVEQGKAISLNFILETPLSTTFRTKNPNFVTPIKVKFGSYGVINTRSWDEDYVPLEISIPHKWCRFQIWQCEFRYQLEADGSLYLVEPDTQELPVKTFTAQPEGFPLHIYKLKNPSQEVTQ